MRHIIFNIFLLISCGPFDTESKTDIDVIEKVKTRLKTTDKKIYKEDFLSCDTGTYLTYDNFGEEFFLNYCTSCHSSHLVKNDSINERYGAPVEINLDSPEDIQLHRVKILNVTRAYFQQIRAEEDAESKDSDGDGIPDIYEDSDKDGIPDKDEDENQNGIPDIYENIFGDNPTETEDDNVNTIMMPPSGYLPIPVLRNLKEYLACGAPQGEGKLK